MSRLRLHRLIERVFIPAYLATNWGLAVLKGGGPSLHFNSIFSWWIRPLLVIVFLYTARPAKASALSRKALLGFILSYFGPTLLTAEPAIESQAVSIVGSLNTTIYLGVLFLAYFTIGRNFGIVPALREVVVDGLYRWVRHPIYSSYIYLEINMALCYPTALNLAVVSASIIGFHLRAVEEEAVLKQEPRYRELLKNVRRRFFSPVLTVPILVLTAFILN